LSGVLKKCHTETFQITDNILLITLNIIMIIILDAQLQLDVAQDCAKLFQRLDKQGSNSALNVIS